MLEKFFFYSIFLQTKKKEGEALNICHLKNFEYIMKSKKNKLGKKKFDPLEKNWLRVRIQQYFLLILKDFYGEKSPGLGFLNINPFIKNKFSIATKKFPGNGKLNLLRSLIFEISWKYLRKIKNSSKGIILLSVISFSREWILQLKVALKHLFVFLNIEKKSFFLKTGNFFEFLIGNLFFCLEEGKNTYRRKFIIFHNLDWRLNIQKDNELIRNCGRFLIFINKSVTKGHLREKFFQKINFTSRKNNTIISKTIKFEIFKNLNYKMRRIIEILKVTQEKLLIIVSDANRGLLLFRFLVIFSKKRWIPSKNIFFSPAKKRFFSHSSKKGIDIFINSDTHGNKKEKIHQIIFFDSTPYVYEKIEKFLKKQLLTQCSTIRIFFLIENFHKFEKLLGLI